MSDYEYTKLEEWLDDPNTYSCPECGGDARIRAAGGNFVNVGCEDYDCDGYPGSICSMNFEDMYDDSEPIVLTPAAAYANGEPEDIVYTCPRCDSTDIERQSYDDGMGYFDVRLECQECELDTWE